MPSESSERKSKMSQENNVINSASEAEVVKETSEASVSAKDSDNGKAKPKKLGKVSIIILISSLVVGIALITLAVLGIVNYIKNNNEAEPKEESVFVYDSAIGVNTFEVGADQYFTVKFTPQTENIGFHIIKIKGANIDSIKMSSGNKITAQTAEATDDGYTNYSAFLYQEYSFRLYSTDATVSIQFEATDPPASE